MVAANLPAVRVSGKLLSMNATEILAKARELHPEERREIAQALLEDLGPGESPEFNAASAVLTPGEAEEIDRRLADHLRNPGDVVAWEEVKARLDAKYKK